MQENSQIPFVKPGRVGNFKIWRSKDQLSVRPDLTQEEAKRMVAEKGKIRNEKVDVECINVSNLDGTWKVQIPSTFEMFSVLNALYADCNGKDEALQQRAKNVLLTIIGNMMYSSAIGNGYYHRALEMIATCYANPTLLEKKGDSHKDLVKDAKNLVKNFLEWRKAWDESRKLQEPTDDDNKKEDFAEQMTEIVEKKEE